MKALGISLPRANKRLTEIYNQTLSLAICDDVVADVGADHGYLSAMLAKSGKFAKVIATDISEPSLEKTAKLAIELNLDIQTRVGDGLTVVPEATLACICGMGGYEIIKILQNNIFAKKFVFQPVQNATELRMYLLKNRYKIISDFVLEDKGKFYYIISVNGFGKNRYSKLEKAFGKNTLNKEDFMLYLKSQLNKLKFLDDINFYKIDKSQRKELKQKKYYYKLCKKLLNK